MRRLAKPSLSRAVRSAIEPLEQRALMCDSHMLDQLAPAPKWSDAIEAAGKAEVAQRSGPEATIIDWTNRGLANDNFATTFGTSAETMRNIVDAALFAWQRVITNWNRSDGSVSLQVTITVQAPGTNFGGSASPGNAPADGKPRTGSVSLGGGNNSADPNDGNGWFVDPDPYDNAEFMGEIINAYTGVTTTGGMDFFSLVTIELAHVLGIISDANNAGGGFENYRLEDFVTNTAVPDIAQGGGNGTYRVFNGATINHLMTSFNSGSGGVNSWGNVIHTAGPTADTTFNGLQYRGSVDPGNALYGPQRYLPSFATTHILADAYGYTIREPMEFGTMYAIIDETSGRLTIRGATGSTVSNDNIAVAFVNGNTIRVSVDIGNDTPGTGALAGAGNLPPFVTDFLAIGVTEIVLDAGDGNDIINIESLPFFADATIRGGLGNDVIQFSQVASNLDTIAAPMSVDGGAGADTVIFRDFNSPNSHAYAVSAGGLTRPGAGAWTISNTERRELYGADGANAFNVASVNAGTTWKLAGHLGNDTFNVGLAGGNADLIDGVLELFGEEGTDALSYNDQTNPLTTTYTVSNTQVLRTGAGSTTYITMESFTLNGGSGADGVIMATGTGSIPMTVFTNAGNDTLSLDSVNYDPNVNHNSMIFLGGNDTDTMNVTPTAGTSTYLTHFDVDASGPIWNYGGYENVNVLGTPSPHTYWIQSTALGVNYSFSGGGGNDGFVLAHFFGYKLDGIDGPVTINGDAGTDTLHLDDQQESIARTYSFSSNLVTSGGSMANVAYGTVEAVSFFGGSGNDGVTVLSTSAAAPLSLSGFTGSDTVDVLDNAPGSPVLVNGQSDFFGFERVNVNTDGTGAASVRFEFSTTLSELNIFNGGTASYFSQGGAKVMETDVLTVAPTGKLELNDNALILDYVGASPLNSIKALLSSGYNGGAWNGNGISSSVAAATPGRALGYAESAAVFSAFPATFAGRAVDSTAVLVRYTLNGDTNLNQQVNLDDFTALASSFGIGSSWVKGDFDYSSTVNLNDFTALAANFGANLPIDLPRAGVNNANGSSIFGSRRIGQVTSAHDDRHRMIDSIEDPTAAAA